MAVGVSEPVIVGTTVVSFLQALQFVALPVSVGWHLALAGALAVTGTWLTRMQTVPKSAGPVQVEIVNVVRTRVEQ